MDFGYAFSRGNETVSLFYPLGLRFFSRGSNVDTRSASRDDAEMALSSAYVRLHGLTPDTIRADDMLGDAPDAHGRVVLRQVTIRIPCTFNLYIVLPVENEPLNVEFVERLMERFMRDRVLLTRSRRERRTRDDGANAGRPRREPQNDNQDFFVSPPKLELVLENVRRGISSLYDLLDSFHGLSAFEAESSGTDRLSDLGVTVEANLYVCRFHDGRLFSAVWKHLCDNANHWSDVYSVPSSLDDECLRFCLDMLFEKRERELLEQQEQQAHNTLNGPPSHFRAAGETLGRRRRHPRAAGPTSTEELVVSCPTLLDDDGAAATFAQTVANAQQSRSDTANDSVDGDGGGTGGLDLYDAFALGSWCLTRLSSEQNRLLVRIDRSIFDRICDSMTDLHDALLARADLRDKLFSAPLAFVPSVIWDIETIAARPGTLPRGTAVDEALVSVAISVERNSLLPDGHPFSLARVHSLAMVLVPTGVKCFPSAINALHLLDESDTQPSILTYRDERAMLVDFCAYMSSQTPLLRMLFNVRPDRLCLLYTSPSPRD